MFADVLRQAVARADRLSDRRLDHRGSVTDASGTQKTPSSNSPTSSRSHLKREPRLSASAGACQGDEPLRRGRAAAAPRARARDRRARSVGSADSSRRACEAAESHRPPSWNSFSGSVRSFSRCSPRSRRPSPSPSSRRVCSESTHLAAVRRQSRSAPPGARRFRRSPLRSASASRCADRFERGRARPRASAAPRRPPRRIRCARESDEERVALRVHLDAAVLTNALSSTRRCSARTSA